MLSCLGRLAGIVAPFAGARYLGANLSPGILWLGAGGIWLSALMMGEYTNAYSASGMHVLTLHSILASGDEGQTNVLSGSYQRKEALAHEHIWNY